MICLGGGDICSLENLRAPPEGVCLLSIAARGVLKRSPVCPSGELEGDLNTICSVLSIATINRVVPWNFMFPVEYSALKLPMGDETLNKVLLLERSWHCRK